MYPASSSPTASAPAHQGRCSSGRSRQSRPPAAAASATDPHRGQEAQPPVIPRPPVHHPTAPSTTAPTMNVMPAPAASAARVASSQPVPMASSRVANGGVRRVGSRVQSSTAAWTDSQRLPPWYPRTVNPTSSSPTAQAPSSACSHAPQTTLAIPSATTASTSEAPSTGRSRYSPKPSVTPPSSSIGTASCSTNAPTPRARSTTPAPTSSNGPTRYGPTPDTSRSPSSSPTTPASGRVASHAPRAVSRTTGQGRSESVEEEGAFMPTLQSAPCAVPV